MISFDQRDVVLVRFVFSEGSGSKKRPAVVISSSAYHRSRQEVLVAAVTSNVERILTGDTPIKQWKQASLLFPSLVTGIIQTVKGEMIERKLGTLAEEDFQSVRQNLKVSFGF